MKAITAFSRCNNAASAVEFAIVAPVFLLILFGVISFGFLMTLNSGVQQLAAESARAGIAGLDTTERKQLARNFIDQNVTSYPYIEKSVLQVQVNEKTGSLPVLEVVLTYDTSRSLAHSFATLLNQSDPVISRRATALLSGM